MTGAESSDMEALVLSLQLGKILPVVQLTILGLGVHPDTKVIHKFGTEITLCVHYTSGSNVAHVSSQCVHCGRCSGDLQSHF